MGRLYSLGVGGICKWATTEPKRMAFPGRGDEPVTQAEGPQTGYIGNMAFRPVGCKPIDIRVSPVKNRHGA